MAFKYELGVNSVPCTIFSLDGGAKEEHDPLSTVTEPQTNLIDSEWQ